MEKIVSQLDPRGYFIASAIADASPLEEGVFLLPGGAIDAEPPEVPEGKRARWDGGKFVFEDIPAPIEPAIDPLVMLKMAVQEYLDSAAQGLGYDDIYTAVSYAEEPAVPKYQAEGKALRQWRSLVWDAANKIRADVQTGKRAVPTAEQLIAELPAFVP